MLYVREIDNDKWVGRNPLDAVSVSDLATPDNEISVWEVQPDLSDIDDIALAVMMRRERVCEITMVYMDSDELLNKYQIAMHKGPGASYFEEMNDKHNNFIAPTFWELGYLTEYIEEKLENPILNTKYYSEPNMTQLLFSAYQNHRIPEEVIKTHGKFKKALKPFNVQI